MSNLVPWSNKCRKCIGKHSFIIVYWICDHDIRYYYSFYVNETRLLLLYYDANHIISWNNYIIFVTYILMDIKSNVGTRLT